MISLLLLLNSTMFAAVELQPAPGTGIIEGDEPHILISALQPGERITVHLFRTAIAYGVNGCPGKPLLAHAEAAFTANKEGTVSVDTALFTEGTYVGVDSLGLLWSGTRIPISGDSARPVTQKVR